MDTKSQERQIYHLSINRPLVDVNPEQLPDFKTNLESSAGYICS